jgi:hypothetical protein
MIWILSTLRVLHNSVLRWSYRAFLPLLLLLLFILSGAACRGDDAARIDVLHLPSGLGHLLGSAWRGGGGLGGLAALFWEPARAQVDEAVAQAADGDFRGAAASTVKAVGVGVAAGVAIGELGAAAVDAIDTGTGLGRTGGQERLKQIGADPNSSSADRGWIKQETNSIDRGQRDTIRNPPGKQLAHTRGREAAKGYNHVASPSNLQDVDLHRTQHKFDNFGRKNKERP